MALCPPPESAGCHFTISRSYRKDLEIHSYQVLCENAVTQGQALGLVHHRVPESKHNFGPINGELVLMSHNIRGTSKGKMKLWRLYEGHDYRHSSP